VILEVESLGRTQVLQAETSDSGRFVFMGVDATGPIRLRSQKAGLHEGAYGQRSAGSTGQAIVLAEGEWKADLAVPLWPLSSIEGRVTTGDGSPVVDASVVAFRQDVLYGHRRYFQGPAARSDDRGIYRIENLYPGDYILAVVSAQLSSPLENAARALKGIPSTRVGSARALFLSNTLPLVLSTGGATVYPTTYHPSSRTAEGAMPINVATGGEWNGVDIRMTPVKAFRIEGRVQSPTTAPLGVTVRLVRASDRDLGLNLPIALARTDPEGRFTFLGVPSGDFVIEVVPQVTALRAPGPASSFRPPDALMPMDLMGITETVLRDVEPPLTVSTVEAQRREELWARQVVSVADTDLTEVVVSVNRTVRVSGVVEVEESKPVDVDTTKSIVSRIGLTLRAEPANARVEDLGVATASVDRSSGKFVLVGLIPGKYVFRVGSRLVKSVELRGQDFSDRPMEVAASDLDGIVLRVTERVAGIEGKVLTNSKAAADDGMVLCFPVSEDQWTNYGISPRGIKTGRLSTSGSFRISGLPAGEYYVIALPLNELRNWQDPAYLREAARVATRVRLEWDRVGVVTLTRRDSGGSLR
jgi:hypothetical protein